MTLREKLETIREASAKAIPSEVRQVMGQATEALRASGILERVRPVGQPAPAFAAHASDGTPVSLEEPPVPYILTFFRGSW